MGEKTNKKCFVCLGASNHSEVEREENDFYATPPIATEALLKIIDLDKNIPILEPCCGKGHISKILEENDFKVVSTDLIYRGYGIGGVDFLEQKSTKESDYNIITNPPYKYAQQFVEKSIEMVKEGNYVIMFLKLTFLEGGKRYEMFKKYPPKYIYVFSDRVNSSLGGDFEKDNETGGAVCYAWYIWEKGFKGNPIIDWIKLKKG